MKKAILIVLTVILLTAVALAVVGASSVAPTPMGSLSVAQPGYAARLVAGLRAHFTTGKSELQRALEAKKDARSFRMTTFLHLHPGHPLETVVEVSCPDRERFTTTIGDRVFHAVRVGGKAYTEQQDGTWSVQDTQPTGWSPCDENPGEPAPWAVMNEGRDPAIVLAKMASHAEFVRGAFVATANGNCQQWSLNLKLPGGAGHGHGANGLNYTVCIDPRQHRLVAVSMGSGGMVTSYSDWNQPIQIDAPKM
jgi:hypothetical protein